LIDFFVWENPKKKTTFFGGLIYERKEKFVYSGTFDHFFGHSYIKEKESQSILGLLLHVYKKRKSQKQLNFKSLSELSSSWLIIWPI